MNSPEPGATPSRTPGWNRCLALELAFDLGLAGAALWQNRSTGLQLELVLLGVALIPVHLRRLLALRAGLRGQPLSWSPAASVLELLALSGVRGDYVHSYATLLALVAALVAGGSPRAPGHARAGTPERARALGLAALGALVLALGPAFQWLHPLVRAGVGLILLGAAVHPGAQAGRDLVRVALFTGLLAAGHQRDNLVPSMLAAVAAAGSSLLSCTRLTLSRRWVLRLTLCCASLLLCVLVGEVAFRIVPNRYQELVPMLPAGQWHVPGARYVYMGAMLSPRQPPDVAPNEFVWNQRGWHDKDHTPAKPPGTLRFLVVGDSFVEGVQVRLPELLQVRLEDALRPATRQAGLEVEGIAMGWSGWGQVQSTDGILGEGLGYQPDLVLMEFLAGNDVRNNSPELERLANEQMSASSLARPLFVEAHRNGLYFLSFVFDRLDLLLRRLQGESEYLDLGVYQVQPRRAELWEDAWRRTREAVARARDALTPRGIGLVVVGYSSPGEVEAAAGAPAKPGEEALDYRLPARRMDAICRELGVPFFALSERFATLPREQRDQLHLLHDGHWSRYGHEHAARFLAEWLTAPGGPWAELLRRRAAGQPPR